MTVKWSAFPSGAAIADTDISVGLQGGANVQWPFSALKTFFLGSSTGALVIAAGKTVTINNSLTLAGTDSTTQTFPSTSGNIPNFGQTVAFAGWQAMSFQ